jgi:ectoine hydroxylase-related dioxygenase (phytanoyl-CoA dioxygenase family)
MTATPAAAPRTWSLTEASCRLDDFVAVVEQRTDLHDYPHADRVVDNVLVYDSARLRVEIATDEGRDGVQAELVRALTDGPGLVVLEAAFDDLSVVDRATDVFNDMIADQKARGATAGDHFAKPGANDRVWNGLEKLAVRDPGVFVDYYANDVLALIFTAWLGPSYQVTSQINVVNPGGAAQSPHRDYHLGFMTNERAAAFPAHVHTLSPVLTLQGAVAHSDMPVASGPTMYLPHSQKYVPGYLTWRRPEFIAYFDQHLVQLPLSKGDAAFFNPALFHGAGHNRSADIKRMANLLQVSSAFGRAMEVIDRQKVANTIFPALLDRKAAGASSESLLNAVAAGAEGYSFPTNLDRDQPVDGLAPETQAELVWRALQEGWDPSTLADELADYATRRRTDDV